MKIFINVFFLLVLSTSFSCQKFITEDLNSNPNAPIDVPINAQMPSIQLSLIDVCGGSFSRRNSMLIQQVEGVARAYSSFNRYSGLTPNHFDEAWQNIYENVLNEISIAKKKAIANDYFHYQGVLNILEAYTLMTASDVWDDIPYSEALNGLNNNNPAYDSQSEIYDNVFQLLNESIVLLEGSTGSFAPTTDDILNNGNSALWIKAAYGIKARANLHQKEYVAAIEAALRSFDSSEDNLSYQYPDANNAANWYRFNRDRTGDIEFHPTMRNLMNSLNDSIRLSVIDHTFNSAHPYLKANYTEDLITYREIQFIIAEADVRLNLGNAQIGHQAYLNGIKASFEKLELDELAYQNYISQPLISQSPSTLKLEEVMTQKYIALFLQSEAYSDWRRTDIPSLIPVSGNNIPVRWHYSSDEYQFNSNAPSESEVNIFTDKVGWDR